MTFWPLEIHNLAIPGTALFPKTIVLRNPFLCTLRHWVDPLGTSERTRWAFGMIQKSSSYLATLFSFWPLSSRIQHICKAEGRESVTHRGMDILLWGWDGRYRRRDWESLVNMFRKALVSRPPSILEQWVKYYRLDSTFDLCWKFCMAWYQIIFSIQFAKIFAGRGEKMWCELMAFVFRLQEGKTQLELFLLNVLSPRDSFNGFNYKATIDKRHQIQ